MLNRCRSESSTEFHNYGARGISVCKDWEKFENFRDYVEEELGPCPSVQHTIDRINNEGNYEPGNIRWASKSEQILNSRQAVGYYAK